MRQHAAQPLEEMLETDWDAQLFRGPAALATMLGWTSYHTLRSKGSKAGYPDRTLVRDRIIFAELKREPRVATPVGPEQVKWLDMLAKAGGEMYLWRPSDLEEISRILGRWTWNPHPTHNERGRTLISPTCSWQPHSLWIPGVGRADSRDPGG